MDTTDQENWSWGLASCEAAVCHFRERRVHGDAIEAIRSASLSAMVAAVAADTVSKPCTIFRRGDNCVIRHRTNLLLLAIRFGTYEQVKYLLHFGADTTAFEVCTLLDGTHVISRSGIDVAHDANRPDAIIELVQDWLGGGETVKSAK